MKTDCTDDLQNITKWAEKLAGNRENKCLIESQIIQTVNQVSTLKTQTKLLFEFLMKHPNVKTIPENWKSEVNIQKISPYKIINCK